MKAFRFVPVMILALSAVLVTTVAAGAATSPARHRHGHTYNCTGGNVPAGTYKSMIITGVCYMPAGTVSIRGNLKIAPGALLDAATAGDPASSPVLPATVRIGGNVWVGRGAVLVLGCSPAGGCKGVTYDHIDGNLTAIGALGTVIQAVSIEGSATLIGGGGGVAGGANSGACFSSPIPAPWSEDAALSNPTTGSPQYSDFEDSSIGGNLTVIGVQTCYLASFRDRVRGSVTFAGNTTSDPDGNELGSNLIGRYLACFDNLPAIQFGDAGAAPNVVGGFAFGECGFNVRKPNPAPSPSTPAGPSEHISVHAWRLGTYSGAHVQTSNVKSVTLGTTASGDTLFLALNNDLLTGSGLTGSITVVPGGPLGQSGEAVATTVRPNGSQTFEAFDNCTCSFHGKSGAVAIEAYGRTSANGSTFGTFLITSGGSNSGGLGTLAGWGTFSSNGEPAGTLRLVEHLKIT